MFLNLDKYYKKKKKPKKRYPSNFGLRAPQNLDYFLCEQAVQIWRNFSKKNTI